MNGPLFIPSPSSGASERAATESRDRGVAINLAGEQSRLLAIRKQRRKATSGSEHSECNVNIQ